jgi:hypothetical protein
MGGLAGHMSHLYDNPSLSFSQMKDIFTKAAQGELVGAEKTDGQNLFLSYSVKDGQAKAARNKGNIKTGGLNARELADKFADRGNLTTTFVEAFDAWERAIANIPMEDRIDIFGPDANVFYNAEIQDPRSANVINYDNKNLVVHREGHAEFDKMTGNVKDVDVSDRWQRLNDYLEQSAVKDGDYRVIGKAMTKLQALSDDEILRNAIGRLESEIDKVGLSDNQNIGDYLVARLDDIVRTKIKLPDETQKELIKRLVGAKGATLNTVLKTLPKEATKQREAVSVIAKDKTILRQAIYPIEDIVHDFSVEILKTLQSAFVLDQGAEVDRLRGEVAAAIKGIEGSGIPEAMQILQKQMQKLKSIDNVSTAAEGFVFDYDGRTYKFTGNFAPINQLLGLFKFGRGKIPPLAQMNEVEEEGGMKIAVVPGGYKPPHLGHLMGVTHFVDELGVDKVLILISPKSRTSSDGTIEIDAEQSKKIWEIFTKKLPQVEVQIASAASPVKATYDYMSTMSPGDTLFLGSGTKDEEDTRFKRAQDWSDKNNLGVTVKHVLTPMNTMGISATVLRNAIAEGNQELFFKAMPSDLAPKDLQAIWDTVSTKAESFLGMQEIHSMLDETLDEMSAMAAGAVAGFAKGKRPKDGDEKLVNEDEEIEESLPMSVAAGSMSAKRDEEENMIEREEFLQEMRLRKFIRRALVLKDKKKKLKDKKKKLEENKLRSIIRKLLVEASEDIPHESTGINVLEELLKKIVPVLEVDFKSLTTDPAQRKSFRAHIIRATQNALAPSVVLDEPPAESEPPDGMVAEDDMNIDIGEPGQDDKFIDIDNDGIPDAEEEDTFSIPGEDETGRNIALQSFEKIEKNIIDSYSILSNEKDRSLFYDYLITNLKLYFDKFEDELRTTVTEPESDIYQRAKNKADANTGDTPDTGIGNTDQELDLTV